MDQAMDKAYNKPAKVQGSVIGFSRRKEAVVQSKLARYQKASITRILDELHHINNGDMYSLHHEFGKNTVYESEKCIQNHADIFLREIIHLMWKLKQE